MKKHPGLVRYTLDVDLTLSILEGDEDDGDSPVVEGFTAEHALEAALVDLKYTKRDLENAEAQARSNPVQLVPTFGTAPTFNKIEAIKALRNLTGMGLRDSKGLVEFVMAHGGLEPPRPEQTREAKDSLASWARDNGYVPHPGPTGLGSGCTCAHCSAKLN